MYAVCHQASVERVTMRIRAALGFMHGKESVLTQAEIKRKGDQLLLAFQQEDNVRVELLYIIFILRTTQ